MFSPTLARHEAARTSQGHSYEVLVVDDSSRDGTAELAIKLHVQYPQSDVHVVVLEKKVGKGTAVQHGMLHRRGRRLLMVDADRASRFEDLELCPLLLPGASSLICLSQRSLVRNVLMYGLHTILRIRAHPQYPLRLQALLLTRCTADLPVSAPTTGIFDVELLLLAKELRTPVAVVPIEWHEVGGSKLHAFADSLQSCCSGGGLFEHGDSG